MSSLLYIVVVLLVITGIYIGYAVVQFQVHLRASADLIATTQPFSFAATNPTKRILIAGDSTAVGVGAEEPNLSTAGRIHADYPLAEITNIGVSGLKTAGLATVLRQLDTEHFDLVILQIGGNDIVRGTGYATLQADITEVLRRAEELGSQVVLFTAGNVGTSRLFPYPLRLLYTHRTLRVREIFMAAARQSHAHYVDLFDDVHIDPFAQDPKTHYAADVFHPSGAGYGVWYRKISATLTQLRW